MNIKVNTSIHNEYNVKCIDTRTDEVTHDLHFHNVVLNNIANAFCNMTTYNSTNGSAKKDYLGFHIGNGSGTPSESDTAMFSFIKKISSSTAAANSLTWTVERVDNVTTKVTISATIPADTSNVYDITEIGIYVPYAAYGEALITHAMLLDSEGNPITIHKTDTDKVILTGVLYITVDMPGFSNIDAYALYWAAHDCQMLAFNSVPNLTCSPAASNLAALRSLYNSTQYRTTNTTCGVAIGDAWGYANTSRNVSARTITYTVSNVRLAEYPMQLYFRGLNLPKMGTLMFPNEDVFPRYKIAGIDVGVGDGETNEFKCPLNYFMKDTDTLYLDGVPLVRDVDYTIDSNNNQDELVEFGVLSTAVSLTGGHYYYTDYAATAFGCRAVSNITHVNSSWGSIGGSWPAYDLYPNEPIYADLGEPKPINTVRVPTNTSAKTVTVSGRNSTEDEWTVITTLTLNSADVDTYKSKFDTVEYRYLKFECTYSSLPYISSATYSTTFPSSYQTNVNTKEGCEKYLFFIGYVGEGIKFTNPPAEGSVITMDAYTDIPMVSPNNVLDVSLSLTIQL